MSKSHGPVVLKVILILPVSKSTEIVFRFYGPDL